MKFKQKMPPALTGKAQAAMVLIVTCAAVLTAPPVAAQTSASPAVSLVAVAEGLKNPWAVAFLPQGQFLVTERTGQMRVVSPSGQVGAPLAGLPAIATGGQGGAAGCGDRRSV